jgi:hypothetical protein
MTRPKIGETVTVNNGGTYEGRRVRVVRLEAGGSLIVRHPNGGSGLLRLKPARTVNGNAIEAQYR